MQAFLDLYGMRSHIEFLDYLCLLNFGNENVVCFIVLQLLIFFVSLAMRDTKVALSVPKSLEKFLLGGQTNERYVFLGVKQHIATSKNIQS